MTDAPAIRVIAVVPPPLNGMTHVTSQMVARMTELGLAKVRTISARRPGSGLRWSLRKHGGLTLAILRSGAGSFRRERCYFVPDSGKGLWINVFEAALMRVLFRETWLHHHVFSYVRERHSAMSAMLFLLGSNAKHIALSPCMATALEATYGISDIRVLGNAGFTQTGPVPTPRSRLKTIGFLGNITREKGIDRFLTILRAAQEKSDSLAALIAGPIADPELRAEVEAFCGEAPDRRIWLGPVRGEAKERFLQRIDLLLFPSRYPNEALPVTIYEALASGAVVLATDRGCIRDQLSGLNCCYRDERYTEMAVARIEAWLEDDADFHVASKAAIERFASQYEVDRQALDDLMDEMAKH